MVIDNLNYLRFKKFGIPFFVFISIFDYQYEIRNRTGLL